MKNTILHTIETLREAPLSLLSKECALSLDAFLQGYKEANRAMGDVVAGLLTSFDGPSAENACRRAFLAHAETRDAYTAVLNALERAVEGTEFGKESPVGDAPTFVEVIRDFVARGLPAVVLGEPTILWLADYVRGYLTGLDVVVPALAEMQRTQLAEFEAWLQREYEAKASWDGIIRVFYGMGADGLVKFVELWDEFNRRPPSGAAAS